MCKRPFEMKKKKKIITDKFENKFDKFKLSLK